MSNHDNGGPAFPCEQTYTPGEGWNQSFDPGMSVLDYFAGQALLGLLPAFENAPEKRNMVSHYLAKRSYEIAEAMLRERSQRNEG